jgi:acetate kinase
MQRVDQKVLEGAEELGLILDENTNVTNCPIESELILDISASGTKTRILVVRTFEGLMTARQWMCTLLSDD